jgi:probable FeS assembly SUF system protein SufT
MSSHRLLGDCPATAIPSGSPSVLPAGTDVFVTQSLGGNVTVRSGGGLFQIKRGDAALLEGYDAGSAGEATGVEKSETGGVFDEQSVWAALRTCFDPEIPVNIVDLGLVYDLAVEKNPAGAHVVEVKMTLTAQGCGMGPTIAEDARRKIAALPTVESARVHIVWDPAWNPRMISPAGRKALGLE